MDNERKELAIRRIEDAISALNDNSFNVYFFVVDTKGNPNGGVEYIYDIALTLHEDGYNVTMLHQESEEFIGPFGWLGERYSVLEHKNVEKDNVAIGVSDFLFIPEFFTNVMTQTKGLPCKRIMVYHNPEYMLDLLPVGVTLSDLGIYDVVVPTPQMRDSLKSYFPNIRGYVVRPSVKNAFYTDDTPKKLIVNLMAKGQTDLNKIIKPFFWKYPAYKWVSFRDMNSPMTADLYPQVLREAAITVWVDDETSNATTALEALKSGNILIAKVPDTVPEWMIEDGELRKDIIWFDDFDTFHNILASVIRGWTRNDIKDEFINVYERVNKIYAPEIHKTDIQRVIVEGIFTERGNEFQQLLSGLKNNVENAD